MKELHAKVLGALSDRKVWEGRQRLFYQMRHDGLPRRSKPFPGAADLHYPLIDMQIEQFKPFYVNQAFSGERFAAFVAMRSQLETVTEAAADCLDYVMKQETNFEEEFMSAIDTMMERGRGILKVFWNAQEKRIEYGSVDPLYFVVAPRAKSIDAADWFCEIKVLTVGEYRRNPAYNQNPEFVKRIRGGVKADDGAQAAEQEKFSREGLTHSTDQNDIIIYEFYQRLADGWAVREWSPNAPNEPVRPAFRLPFRFRGKPFQPYVSVTMEVKDKGWFAPRGLAERLAPFEASLCKHWNEKHDCMSFYNRPLFKRTGNVNAANIRFQPGELLPEHIEPVQMPQPPFSFDQEMNATANMAKALVAAPDAGINAEQEGGRSKQFATAAQVNFQQALASSGVDLKGTVFRMGLKDVFWKTWGLILMYRKDAVEYFVGGELRKLPQEALHDAYLIRPDGSPDKWNKQQNVQRAGMLMQSLKGAPNVDQDELVKAFLVANDARLIDKLFVPTGVREKREAEDEASEILLLKEGYPAHAEGHEDHATRVNVLLGHVELVQKGMVPPMSELGAQRLQEHLQEHLEFLRKVNPGAAKEAEGVLQGMMAPQQPQGMIDGGSMEGGSPSPLPSPPGEGMEPATVGGAV